MGSWLRWGIASMLATLFWSELINEQHGVIMRCFLVLGAVSWTLSAVLSWLEIHHQPEQEEVE